MKTRMRMRKITESFSEPVAGFFWQTEEEFKKLTEVKNSFRGKTIS